MNPIDLKTRDVTEKIDETSQWYRDLLIKVMGWGTALFTLMVGWLMNTEDGFISFSSNISGASDRALALLIIAPLMWGGWFYICVKLRSLCSAHPTVPPKIGVLIYCLGLTLVAAVMVVAVIKD